MTLNCEAPFFLMTALYPFMAPVDDKGVAGSVLHVSSGEAHGAPPVGWSVYGISKAAFFQSYKVLEREYRHLGGKAVVGSSSRELSTRRFWERFVMPQRRQGQSSETFRA
mgnify:FL=1